MPPKLIRSGYALAQAVLLLCLCISLFLTGFSRGQAKQTSKPEKYLQLVRTFHSPAEFQKLTLGKVKITRNIPKDELSNLQSFAGTPRIQWSDVTVIARQGVSLICLGTNHGAFVFMADVAPEKARPRYFAGKRWLPDDHVIGAGFEAAGSIVWIETPKGFSRIEDKEMTLAEKSKAFIERIRARHVRWGMTSDSHLKIPGDLSSNQMVSSDNDGLWTQMYIAAEAFRYAVTKEADARANAKQGFEAMLRLEEITGISGFHARSIIKIGEDIQPKDGEWHTTPDGKWRWKGDTSSDEIVGHYFGYAVYYDLVADEAEKEKVRGVVRRMTNHILDNNYQLIDTDGKRTRWGWWGPDAIWEDPDELGLRALHILAHLRTAFHITGDTKFKAAYDELISKHRYHLLTRNQKINYPGRVNHSDDELAFLSYYPLLIYETDKKLREVYLDSLERAWQVERPERNPLWNFIYAACRYADGSGAKEFDRAESLRTLQEIPMDQIEWTVINSHRLDVPIDPLSDRFKRGQALIVLPYDELPMTKWNGNPYRLDGGNGGRSEDDGAYFLLPYWMGRYHKLIGE